MLSVISHGFIAWSFSFKQPKHVAKAPAPHSGLFVHSWLRTPGLPGPHRPPTLLPNLLPNTSPSPPPLQPSWPHLDSCGDQTADASLVLLQVTLACAQEDLSKAETRSCPSSSSPAPSVMKYNPNFLRRSSKEPPALAISSLTFCLLWLRCFSFCSSNTPAHSQLRAVQVCFTRLGPDLCTDAPVKAPLPSAPPSNSLPQGLVLVPDLAC